MYKRLYLKTIRMKNIRESIRSKFGWQYIQESI